MAGVNKAIILGRCGRDPEVKYLQNGTAVCSFSVATSEQWNDKNTGEKKEKVQWHNISAWARLGEVCGQYLSKGKEVFVEGRIEYEEYEKDGIKRYSTKIIAISVQFIGSKNDQQPPARPQPPQGGYQPPNDGYNYPKNTANKPMQF